MASISAYDKMSYGKVNLPTLQEMMVAPQYLEEQHNLALQESGKLSAEANMAATLAMENPNSKAAKSYQAYVADLNKATSALSEKGVQGSNIKAALSSARGRYTSEIMPIVQAGAVREKDLAVLNEAKMKDPTLLYNADPLAYSIDSYISRGNSSYIPDAISGTQLQEQVANKVKFLRDQFRQGGDKMFSKTNLPYEYMAKLDYGATPAEVEQAMVREGYDAKEVNQMTAMLHGAIDTTLQANGVYDKFASNPGLIDQAWKFGAQGAYAAIGKSDTQFKTDQYGMTMSIKAAEEAKKAKETAPVFYRDKSFVENTGTAKDLQKIQDSLGTLYGEKKDSVTKPVLGATTSAVLQFMGPMLGALGQTTNTGLKGVLKNSPVVKNLVGTIEEFSESMDKRQAAAIEPLAKRYGISLRDASGKLKPKAEVQFELEDAKEYAAIGFSSRAFDLEGEGGQRLGNRISEGGDKKLNDKVLITTDKGEIKGVNGTMYFEKYLGDLSVRNEDGKHPINPNFISTQAATIMKNIRRGTVEALGLEGVDIEKPIPADVFGKGFKTLVDEVYQEAYAKETQVFNNAVAQIESSGYTTTEKERLGKELQRVTVEKLKLHKQTAKEQVEQYLDSVTEPDINTMNALVINFTAAQKPVNFELK